MKTITIFDLDHTLLDSKKLKEDIAEILDMSVGDYNKSYNENFEKKNINYSFKEHLKILKEDDYFKLNGSYEKAERDFDNKFKEMDYLLNDGYLELIASEKSKGHKTIMVTFGNKYWQEEKISKLGKLKELFGKDEIFCIDEDKANYVSELYENEAKYIIINDNIKETIRMVDKLGKGNCEVKIIGGKYHSEEEVLEARELALSAGFEFYESIRALVSINNEYSNEFKKMA